ncbi:hypothetical protein C6N75_03680 [Streptomyces solincola]|uniref:Uncharacterized protein n=1 Tax=Streptomyces solincola TaxID=2100817 RepID=A0A2S9Q1H9_9ACTN|nr:hypothetical protein C6N75_03680 [Streptomyces solincola]
MADRLDHGGQLVNWLDQFFRARFRAFGRPVPSRRPARGQADGGRAVLPWTTSWVASSSRSVSVRSPSLIRSRVLAAIAAMSNSGWRTV